MADQSESSTLIGGLEPQGEPIGDLAGDAMETGRRWGARHSRGWGRLGWARPEVRGEWWRLTAVGIGMCGLWTLARFWPPPPGGPT